MKKINWKLLGPADIEVRAQFLSQDKKDKMLLLLYQTARTAQDAFDEQFGEFGWTCEYRAVGDKIYGRISVKDTETGEWIYKEDTGTESNIAADKGQASDIFKRVAVKWGFARELYTAPRIIVDNDGYNCTGYRVSKIEYNDRREITALIIVNCFGKVVYDYNGENAENRAVSEPKKNISPAETLKAFCHNKKKAPNINIECLKKFYDFYLKKMGAWKGKIDCPTLWDRWISRERAA